jgi:hypothetical protein
MNNFQKKTKYLSLINNNINKNIGDGIGIVAFLEVAFGPAYSYQHRSI